MGKRAVQGAGGRRLAGQRGQRGQRGQATVEWIGLVLGLALAFGGAAVAAGGADFGGEADELGEALATRVTCAARDACAAGVRTAPHLKPAPPIRPTPAPPLPKRAETGGGALRAFGKAGRFASAACLGYRRFQYDLEHPRTPRQGIPVGDTLGILNDCLNPLGFLFP